ncbi:MAG: hypothetical protein ACRBHB_13580 [Arenicella sp.]
MHIVLAVLGAVVTILILVRRLSDAGIDIGWLNPFSWYRRNQWKKKVSANPAFLLDSPMEAVAGLMYVAAKCSGDITREHKELLLQLFESEFEIDKNNAVELLASSSFLIKDEDDVAGNISKFLKPSIEKFSTDQLKMTTELVARVIHVDQTPTEKQQKFLSDLTKLISPQSQQGNWS